MTAGRGKPQNAFRLTYPITSEVAAALTRFSEIGKAVPIPSIGRSELEIVRLLLNADTPESARLLTFINTWLPTSGATDLVKQRDPFQFRRLLAELYLFAHLRTHLGAAPRRVMLRPDEKGPDMEAPWRGQLVKFEVY